MNGQGIGRAALWVAALAGVAGACWFVVHTAFKREGGGAEPLKPAQITRIKIDEAKTDFDRGVQFFDARGKDQYDAGHVKGAIMIDPADPDFVGASEKPEFLRKFDPSLPFVIYCTGGDCDASQLVALKLKQFGFTTLKIFEGGFKEWQAAGHPVAKV